VVLAERLSVREELELEDFEELVFAPEVAPDELMRVAHCEPFAPNRELAPAPRSGLMLTAVGSDAAGVLLGASGAVDQCQIQ
jgi:hypothetical protein